MNKSQRIGAFGLAVGLIAAVYVIPPLRPSVEGWVDALLLSGLILLALATLFLEHFLTRPSDVVSASVSVLLLLLPARELLQSWGVSYWVFVAGSAAVLVIALAALLLLSPIESENSARNRWSRRLKVVATSVGGAKKQYFVLALLTAVFFLDPATPPFVAIVLIALAVVAFEPQKFPARWSRASRPLPEEIGEILGVRGRDTFRVRLHPRGQRPAVHASDVVEFSYGMDEPPRVRIGVVLERYFLDQAQWINVLCIDETTTRDAAEQRRSDAVYLHPNSDAAEVLDSLVGVVIDGSDIQTLRFLHAGRGAVHEGALVEVRAKEKVVLYQVVNAEIGFETLESHNRADLVAGEAVQLGTWDADNRRFERYGWVPAAYTPLHKCGAVTKPVLGAAEISLGAIPGSDYEVILNKNDAISHHTAILGVTGAGKSVFARNLVRQLVADEDVRVIVVDFTREWEGAFPEATTTKLITAESEAGLNGAINRYTREMAKFRDRRDDNVIRQARDDLATGFGAAIEAFVSGERRLGVFELPDVSNTEGVLEFTQAFFWRLFNLAKADALGGRRICIVLEEAHTVIPEWNFVGLADKSSQALVNNLSQIALQGRKYGVGFVVIAQRTANVSKTVLTQCNTVIAFQCFDNTSIGFLENYLPKAMTAAVPNLKFRHAIAVGKAVAGSVPLMFEVPIIEDATAAGPPE